jgi:hypothetical protein
MKELAENIAREIFIRLEPELHKAMVQKIISVASEKWRFQFTGDREISEIINHAIERALVEKYKPAIEYIANKKAREKVLKRATQNDIPAHEIESLFEV